MRYIDINQLKRPDGWQERAEQALEAVQNALPEERSQEIARHADVWRELKEQLAALSHGKCWYCETVVNERQDADVDHFRPKSQVTTVDDNNFEEIRPINGHLGYWWLAFDWRNYRYSCRYCNVRRRDPTTNRTGGKGTLFPLLDENTRAYSPEEDIGKEKVTLLDPTNSRDPTLLWFDENGEAQPSPSSNTEDKKRAQISIHIYHLNFSLTKQRRQVLANEIKSYLQNAVRYLQEDNKEALEETLKKIISSVRAEANFSAAARCYLMGMRSSKHEERNVIIEMVLQTL